MTGSVARELSRLPGCLSAAVVVAVRDTLTPTPVPGLPEPRVRMIKRVNTAKALFRSGICLFYFGGNKILGYHTFWNINHCFLTNISVVKKSSQKKELLFKNI